MCLWFSHFFWETEVDEPLLVRNGANVSLGYDRDGNALHTRANVVTEMFLTICRYYPGLPDPRTLDLDEIEFFYDGIRYQLIEDTKPHA